MNELNHRYDFLLLFDVQDGNPNGDPDAGNLPRIDPETGHGIVTDVCLKRKIRNYVHLRKHDVPPFRIYVQEKAILNNLHKEAHQSIDDNKSQSGEKKNKNRDKEEEARKWICQNFFDVRTFGAVMSTGKKDEDTKCGQVRGPVQLTFSRSIDPVVTLEYCITRLCVTKEEDLEKERTMGRKFTIPYGLYKCHGFFSPNLASQTQFSEQDLDLLWDSLLNMFEHDRSASRGLMQTRGLYVFKHDSELGNAPAHKLFDTIRIKKQTPDTVARSFNDYLVEADTNLVPQGVKLIQMHLERVAAGA